MPEAKITPPEFRQMLHHLKSGAADGGLPERGTPEYEALRKAWAPLQATPDEERAILRRLCNGAG